MFFIRLVSSLTYIREHRGRHEISDQAPVSSIRDSIPGFCFVAQLLSYGADIRGADPDRKNGPVFRWEVVE